MKRHILYYNKLVKRYNKYQRKLERSGQSTFHNKRVDLFIKRIKELGEKIERLGLALKAATAGSAVALSMMLTPMTASGQALTLESSNQVGLSHAENYAAPIFHDVDGDDDLDLVIGERYNNTKGGVFVWINDGGNFSLDNGSQLSALNLQIDAVHNIPNADEGGAYNQPAFVDVDGDDDYDLFIGHTNGDNSTGADYERLRYFENVAGTYTERTGQDNPLSGYSDGDHANPDFVDLDNDGDLDAVIGKGNGEIQYWANNGDGTFTQQNDAANPFNGLSLGEWAAPAFADLDADGDLDGYIGIKSGDIVFLENTGSAMTPTFTEDDGTNNPFDSFNFGDNSAPNPAFADLDGDSDLDAYVGILNGPVLMLENDGGTFTEKNSNDLGITDVGDNARTAAVDWDEDGDMDVVVGNNDTMKYFENDGSGSFTEIEGTEHPLLDANTALSTASAMQPAPEFVDWNGDGYMDLFVGTDDHGIFYFQNDGSGNLTDMTDSDDNPFKASINTVADPADLEDHEYNPGFIDLDGDGDLDAFVGNKDGDLLYFENDGNGALTQVTGAGNPFDGESLDSRVKPEFYDWDRDGDLDCLIGKGNGEVVFYLNDGDGTFTKQDGAANPFNGVKFVDNPSPTFADLDGDGVQDVLMGDRAGFSWFYSNAGTAQGPTAASIDDQFLVEGEAYEFVVPEFTDANNDVWVYRAQQAGGASLPAWLSYDRTTRTFSGTPSNANVGSLDIEVTAVDADNNTATASFTIYVQLITGLSELSEVTVYPNPTLDRLNINTPWATDKTVELVSLSGQVMRSFTTLNQNVTINMSDLKNGVYILKLNSADGRIFRKIVKN